MRGMDKLKLTAAAALTAVMLGACDTGEEAADNGLAGPVSEAPAVPLVNASGEIIGEVHGGDSDNGARFLIDARGLPPGEHAMHIHDIGICETPGFTSAGPHWNPTGAQHGGQNPQGPHMGDLQNVTVGQDGRLRAEIVVPGTYLRNVGRDTAAGAHQILDASGAALVIHAKADDYRTDPAGAAGDRIACAVLGAPAPGAVVDQPGQAAGGNAAATEDPIGTADIPVNESGVYSENNRIIVAENVAGNPGQ